MPRRWHQVCENKFSQATVANKPGHRGERDISCKTIARGMPGVSGVTVVTNARAFYTTRAAAGASGARHSLRPLIGEGGTSRPKLARNARRDRGFVFDVIARSEATKQSILAVRVAAWIASQALAMTV
jgi:hypothetical protein